ncbi:unnamed protein product [Amoebophrya sp. A25]|nr:unnamed protein product [Amoebophrya sp. A25]|eukprot:GSA25T00016149001.1
MLPCSGLSRCFQCAWGVAWARSRRGAGPRLRQLRRVGLGRRLFVTCVVFVSLPRWALLV